MQKVTHSTTVNVGRGKAFFVLSPGRERYSFSFMILQSSQNRSVSADSIYYIFNSTESIYVDIIDTDNNNWCRIIDKLGSDTGESYCSFLKNSINLVNFNGE